MSLPNVAHVLNAWKRTYRIKTVTRQTVDFESADAVAGRDIDAVVQVAQKEKLNPDQIDWSLRYLLIHSPDPVSVGELFVYDGEDYKIIEPGDWQLYGYTEAIAEETKQPVVQETV